jgi:hypothetical protein
LRPEQHPITTSGLREALIAAGAIVPGATVARGEGTRGLWHDEPPTLRMLGNENTAPQSWRELRTQEEKP